MSIIMDGIRKYIFDPDDGSANLELDKTDFWVDYATSLNGGNVDLQVTLNNIWNHVDIAHDYGLERRVVAETYLEFLQSYVGKRGTLYIDPHEIAFTKTLTGVQLRAVQPQQFDNNALVEYALVFGYPIGPSGGRQIARTFQWGENADTDKIVVNSRNLVVRWFRQDTTTFKSVFRASPVRVENGPSISTMILSGIEEAISGSSPLSGRQVIEAKYIAWAYTEIGSARKVTIDGISHGTLHLHDVRPGALDLPDAWTWELEFNGAYAT